MCLNNKKMEKRTRERVKKSEQKTARCAGATLSTSELGQSTVQSEKVQKKLAKLWCFL